MNQVLLLLPVALFLGFAGLMAFMWSLKSGQYDDLDGAMQRVLTDDRDDGGALASFRAEEHEDRTGA